MSEHSHGHADDQHGHSHANDQGAKAMLRYLRNAPKLWRSDVNNAVVDLLDPKNGQLLLDIGAGMGPGTVRAASKGANVIAVDPTAFLRRILQARRLFQKSRKLIAVVDGSAEKLPVEDASIDGIWAVNTMHHWVDVDLGVAEIARVLKPSGRVILVDEDFEDPEHPYYESFKKRHQGDDQHHGFSMVDATQMGDRMTAAGLVDVEASKRRIAGRPVIAVTASAAHPTN